MIQTMNGQERADDRRHRHAADAFSGTRYGRRVLRLAEAQLDHRELRGREGEQDTEAEEARRGRGPGALSAQPKS